MVDLSCWYYNSRGIRKNARWKAWVFILNVLGTVAARKNEKYEMHRICYESREGNFMSNIPRTVDGVVVESNDERDEDCVVSFQTESVVEKFLLKFDRLQMDCNDHLYIYDGAHVAGPWRAHISCESEPKSVGSNGFIITRTNFVTLRYHTDSWGSEKNGFTLVITAFKNSQTLGCATGFSCDSMICINSDLVCDNVSHCGHGEDEMDKNNCSGDSVYDLIGLEVYQLVGAILLLLLLLVAGGTAAWIWTCRQDRERLARELLLANSYNIKRNIRMKGHLTAVVGKNGSGNLILPVQGQGYKHIRQTHYLGG